MKILVVTQYYYPEQFRITDICESLVKRGHRVTVLTGLPNYPAGEIYPGYETAYQQPQMRNGVEILRCNLRPRHQGTRNLARNYLSFILQGNKLARKLPRDFDVVYVYETSPITQALPAITIQRRHKIPAYLYCMDIWPESVRDVQNGHAVMKKSHPIFLVSKWISKYIYNHMDRIGVKCAGFAKYLEEECAVPKEKMVLLPEHAEADYLSVPEQTVDNGCIDFMFLGNIGATQMCDAFLQAAKNISSDVPFKLHFVGDGSDLERLKSLAQNTGLDEKVVFHGRCPLEEVMEYYKYADCCLLSLSSQTALGMTPPGKLYGYMAAARPILAVISGETPEIIADAQCGWCVQPGDIPALETLMRDILEGKKDLKRAGRNGRQYFLRNYTLEKHLEQLENQLDALCK